MARTLCLDVSFHIMAFADDPTVCRLMQVNKFFNIEGAKYLLDDSCITIASSRQLDSLITFLSAYNGARLQFLKGLCLEMQSLSISVPKRLGALLTAHTDKITMTLLDITHLDSIISSCRALYAAFASLTTITHIRFAGINTVGSGFLRDFKSKVKVADLRWDPTPNIRLTESASDEAKIPISVLKNFQSSLVDLSATNVSFQRSNGDNTFDEVYPRLTDLQIQGVLITGMHTRTLVRAFPNLQNLVMVQPSTHRGDDPTALDAQHEHNIAEQLAHRSWPSLETISGGLLDMYILAPTCQVQEVHVTGPYMQTRALRRLLKRTRPAQLALAQFEGDLFTPALTEMLRKPCAARVECLEVMFRMGCTLPADTIDAPVMVESWIAAIRGLPRVRVLSIALHGAFLQFTRSGPHRFEPSAAERFFAALDLSALAQRLKDTIPTLKTVELTVEGVRGRREPRWVRLGPEDMEFETCAAATARMLNSQMPELGTLGTLGFVHSAN
ncbi:uncharacterized protein BXZ73DRAFT_104478 [Epithele typhae]|uniref:uncharacterized protein n=1 Tax=Epithele typhae TaxID=378194 RepID=UPI002007D0B7|nr:uncharacterized protein BXZ73DRAFT_104478 [Epithele typhae]KAH9921190.1 hypothetical protein BXZ73DRAFT_104478 [Epithele typhae]